MAASTLDPAELDRFLTVSRAVLRRAMLRGTAGDVLLATPRDAAPAIVSTRDLAAAIVCFCELGDLDYARQLCEFLLRVQAPTGAWSALYDADGVGLPGPLAEDVTAFVVWALLTFARASGDTAFVEQVREPTEQVARYTLERTLNPYLYLVETTSALHGGTLNEGYDLWTNCVHAAAFALAHRQYGGERFRRLGLLIRRSIGLLMTQDGRFLRRLDQNGYPDPRPDITLMAPYYFSLWAPNERSVMNSAELIERVLWNVEVGGYTRLLPYSPAERGRLPGPWPLFSAWMAQFHFDASNKDRGETILRWLFGVMRNGELPESLVPAASVRRFGREQRRALEGQAATTAPLLAAEREHQLLELDRLEQEREQSGPLRLGGPSVWAHLETLRALKRSGHVERWEADPAHHGAQHDPMTG